VSAKAITALLHRRESQAPGLQTLKMVRDRTNNSSQFFGICLLGYETLPNLSLTIRAPSALGLGALITPPRSLAMPDTRSPSPQMAKTRRLTVSILR
jgi:hypothetical protein